MSDNAIVADLPPELVARARTFIRDGWASDFDELITEALRRFLESHSSQAKETDVMEDVRWGLHGSE